MAARELFKRCACPDGKWAKCDHGWHFRKQVAGRRVQVSLDDWLGHRTIRGVTAAERVREDIVELLRAGTFSPLGPPDSRAVREAAIPRTASEWTFATVVAAYVQAYRDDPERNHDYTRNVAGRLAPAVTWPLLAPRGGVTTLGDLPIGAVTTALLETYYKSRVTLGRANGTRNKLLQELRRLGRWTVKKGYRPTAWLERDETELRRRKEAHRHRRLALAVLDADGQVVVPSEEDRLLAVADPRLRVLIIAGLESCQRLGELLRLQWAQVDFARHRLRIADGKDPDRVTFRDVPLSARLRAELLMHQTAPDGTVHPPAAYVFGNEVGEPIGSIMTAWETAVLKAHGEPIVRDPRTKAINRACRDAYNRIDLVFHDLRHEGGSRLLELGWPLHRVKEMLGHKSIATTEIYLNVRAGDLTAQMAETDAARAAVLPAPSGFVRKSGAPVAQSAVFGPKTTPGLKRGKAANSRVH